MPRTASRSLFAAFVSPTRGRNKVRVGVTLGLGAPATPRQPEVRLGGTNIGGVPRSRGPEVTEARGSRELGPGVWPRGIDLFEGAGSFPGLAASPF